ncbi:mannan-binding family protein [Mycobacterium ulcerans]|uniref:mannan-binding family protein n=1 Tax=Mycobacterium ulcerans TaxID=1809 RepID=UPI001F05140A|nr:mannan-binding family protein [Mycobacterium ulcerans]
MPITRLLTTLTLVVAAATSGFVSPPTARASASSFCGELGGDWDGQYCHTSVVSERKAVRDIKVAVPADLIDDATAGPVVRDYLRTLVTNWKSVGAQMVADSFVEENYQVFRHGSMLSAVFHEDYHADGPKPNNAYRTFTFDTGGGRRVQLADLTTSNPLTAIPPLGQPYIQAALDAAAPPHDPGTYPFVADRWTPDKVYSGGYRAWALTPDELVLYLPDYPVGHDEPIDFMPGAAQWSMDGGAVVAHIPLSALGPVLRG